MNAISIMVYVTGGLSFCFIAYYALLDLASASRSWVWPQIFQPRRQSRLTTHKHEHLVGLVDLH